MKLLVTWLLGLYTMFFDDRAIYEHRVVNFWHACECCSLVRCFERLTIDKNRLSSNGRELKRLSLMIKLLL